MCCVIADLAVVVLVGTEENINTSGGLDKILLESKVKQVSMVYGSISELCDDIITSLYLYSFCVSCAFDSPNNQTWCYATTV